MSGQTVSRALAERFESIRLAEIDRLEKKLRGLSEVDRLSVHAITADIIEAIARVPQQAIAEVPQQSVDAFARLFDLEA